MLIVISCPTAVADEAGIINALFDEGLKILHLRKPGIEIDELNTLLRKIKPQYLHRIALHQHHAVACDFGIKRLHFTETLRKGSNEEELLHLINEKNILSTSSHQTMEYQNLSACFEYTFYGPVFNSISKQGYSSTLPDDFIFPVELNHPRPIAIGGIDVSNFKKALDMQFDGVAVLGTIWQNIDESIQKFKILQSAWIQTGR
jgi:thiamine-phosphate pyrophosphorylase